MDIWHALFDGIACLLVVLNVPVNVLLAFYVWETVCILPPANRILSFLQLANRRRPIVTPADRRLPFVPLANGRRLYENLIWYQSGTIYLKIVIYELLGIFLMFLLWFKYIYKLHFTSHWTHKMECKIPEKGNHVNKVYKTIFQTTLSSQFKHGCWRPITVSDLWRFRFQSVYRRSIYPLISMQQLLSLDTLCIWSSFPE